MSDPTPEGDRPTTPLPAPQGGAPAPPPYATPIPPAYAAPTPPPYGAPAPDAPPYRQTYGQQPPYGAAPVYGQAPAYGRAPGYGYPVAPKTNTLAIVSLIASLSAFVLLPIIGSIVGIVTGHISLTQLKTSGESGRGIALAGTITGWVSVGLGLLAIAVLLLLVWIPFAATVRYA